jgi:hypothetical protein
MKHGARAAIVVVTIFCWFVVSNHCSFAALSITTTSVGCPFHSKPAKQEKQSNGAQCCKILRAVTSVATKNWNRDDTKFSGVDLQAEKRADAEHLPIPAAAFSLDTGPPNAYSFAELILQRSLLAHAPPFVA